ncbi:MAG: hypothetical protein GKR95_02655 [Gammaproteobacteria bacterium]|nr:hypothetical protein [Gammaproteobacteria bacterium]
MKQETQHWTERKEISNKSGISILLFFMKLVGPGFVKVLVIPVAFYYYLSSKETRRVSKRYLTRVHKAIRDSRFTEASQNNTREIPATALRYSVAGLLGLDRAQKVRWFHVYRHILAFSHSMVDRMFAWKYGLPESKYKGSDFDCLAEVLDGKGKGAIILVSHLGNFDVAISRSHLNPETTFNIVINMRHSQTFNQFRGKIFSEKKVRFIDPQDITPMTMIDLSQRIDQGEILVIAADRTTTSDSSTSVGIKFLGAEANFPIGPFVLAHLLQSPVYTLFSIRKSGNFLIDFKLFKSQIQLPRSNRQAAITCYAAQYANQLESNCKRYPFQWYNFFDFWSRD